MSKIPRWVQIKSQPLSNKILGLADKTSYTGVDFTLPTCNKIYPLISVLPDHSPPQTKLYEMTTSLKLWLNQFDVLLGQLWHIWHMFLENKRTYILIRAAADLMRHKHKQKSRCYPWTGAHQFKGFYFLICFIIASLLCQGTECGLIVSTFVWVFSYLFGFVKFCPIALWTQKIH